MDVLVAVGFPGNSPQGDEGGSAETIMNKVIIIRISKQQTTTPGWTVYIFVTSKFNGLRKI